MTRWARTDLSMVLLRDGEPHFSMAMAATDKREIDIEATAPVSAATASMRNRATDATLDPGPEIDLTGEIATVTIDGNALGFTRGDVYELRVDFTAVDGSEIWSGTFVIEVLA